MNPDALPLRDIHLPPAPGFWPLAPGWWVLLVLTAAAALWLLWRWLRWRRAQRRLRALQEATGRLAFEHRKNADDHWLAAQTSQLLRRYVRHHLGDQAAAALAGDAWIDFLNSRLRKASFDPHRQALLHGAFQPHIELDAPALLHTVNLFMQQNNRSGTHV